MHFLFKEFFSSIIFVDIIKSEIIRNYANCLIMLHIFITLYHIHIALCVLLCYYNVIYEFSYAAVSSPIKKNTSTQ